MKCTACNGKGGVGHYTTEPDHFRRPVHVSGSERFFPCHTCEGTGQVTEAKHSQSMLAEDDRQRAFDNEMGDLQTKFEQQLRREEWTRSRYYN